MRSLFGKLLGHSSAVCRGCRNHVDRSDLVDERCFSCRQSGRDNATCRMCETHSKLNEKGFCAACWDVAQWREENGDPCETCGVLRHKSMLKRGKCASCTQTSAGGGETTASSSTTSSWREKQKNIDRKREERGERSERAEECTCRECGREAARLRKGFCDDCWITAQWKEENGDPCVVCRELRHPSMLKAGKCASCSQTKGEVRNEKKEDKEERDSLGRVKPRAAGGEGRKRRGKDESRHVEGRCRDCGSKSPNTKGYCSDCWSTAQYKEENGDPCSICKELRHPSMLKGGKCASCTQTQSTGMFSLHAPKQAQSSEKVFKFDSARGYGDVVVFGANAYGQTGTNSLSGALPDVSPCLLPNLQQAVKFVSCGLYHSALVTETNVLFTFGRGVEGQLGYSCSFGSHVPTEVTIAKGVLDVTALECGSYHTAVLANGTVWECGRGSHVFSTVRLPLGEVRMLTAAGNASCAYTADMNVYIWNKTSASEPDSIAELRGVPIAMLKGSKFEIVCVRDDGLMLSFPIFDVAADFRNVRSKPMTEVQAISSGVCDLSIGAGESAAVTFQGDAVCWKRDASTGEMKTSPVKIPVDAPLSTTCGWFSKCVISARGVHILGRNESDLDRLLAGNFQKVALGFGHGIALTGAFQGASTFTIDFQNLFLSQKLTDASFSGVPCHTAFLSASGVPSGVALNDLSENAARAYLLYLYTERFSNISQDSLSAELHPVVTQYGPERLLAIIERRPYQPPSLPSRLLSVQDAGDVDLLCEDGSVRAFRAVIAARSAYFDAAFSDRWAVQQSFPVVYSKAAIQVFVKFCCGVSVTDCGLDIDNAVDVLQLANEYGVVPLLRFSESFLVEALHNDPSAAPVLYDLAVLLERKFLATACERIMSKR